MPSSPITRAIWRRPWSPTTIDIIEERRVDHASVREVAKRAGVSPGAPFRHFRSKAQILMAVAEQAMERLAEAVLAAQAPDDADPLGQLERIGQGYLAWARAHPTHFQIVSSRSLVDFADSPKLRDLNDRICARMIDLLIMARQRGDLPTDADIDRPCWPAAPSSMGLPGCSSMAIIPNGSLSARPRSGWIAHWPISFKDCAGRADLCHALCRETA